jgi:hypothetical protein
MAASVQTKPDTRGIVATLGRSQLPLELDRLHLLGRDGSTPLAFRFVFQEVPFSCTAERQGDRAMLALTGDFGALPYTAESADRRRSVQSALAEARRDSGLDWEVTPQQEIEVKGDIDLGLPLTPVALVAGAVTLLMRARPSLERLLGALTQPA